MSLSGSFVSPNTRAVVMHVSTQAGSRPFSTRWWQNVHFCTTPESPAMWRTP